MPVTAANTAGALDCRWIQNWNQPCSQDGCPLATDFNWLM